MPERSRQNHFQPDKAALILEPTIYSSLQAIDKFRRDKSITPDEGRKMFAYTVFINEPSLLPLVADVLMVPKSDVNAYLHTVYENESLHEKADVIFESQQKKKSGPQTFKEDKTTKEAIGTVRETVVYLLYKPLRIGTISQEITRYFPYLLNQTQTQIVELAMQGLTNDEIGEKLEYSPKYVKQCIIKARRSLEEVLSRDGIKRVFDYKQRDLSRVPLKQKLHSEVFLRMPYATDADVIAFNRGLKPYFDLEMAQKGLVPFRPAVNNTEYRFVMSHKLQATFCEKKGRRLYISPRRITELRKLIKQTAEQQRAKNPEKKTFLLDFNRAIARLKLVLTDTQIQFINDADRGLTNAEIAEKYGTTPDHVEYAISRARGKVEKLLFIPKGIKSVASYRSDALRTAAHRGSLPSKKFARRPYTSDWHVKRYEAKQRKIDQESLEQGLVPLISLVGNAITRNDYDLFRHVKQYAQFIKRRGHVIYVNPDSIPEMLAMKRSKDTDNGITSDPIVIFDAEGEEKIA